MGCFKRLPMLQLPASRRRPIQLRVHLVSGLILHPPIIIIRCPFTPTRLPARPISPDSPRPCNKAQRSRHPERSGTESKNEGSQIISASPFSLAVTYRKETCPSFLLIIGWPRQLVVWVAESHRRSPWTARGRLLRARNGFARARATSSPGHPDALAHGFGISAYSSG